MQQCGRWWKLFSCDSAAALGNSGDDQYGNFGAMVMVVVILVQWCSLIDGSRKRTGAECTRSSMPDIDRTSMGSWGPDFQSFNIFPPSGIFSYFMFLG